MHNIIGHQKAKKNLRTNKNFQSFLIYGMRGIGKATLAKAFASEIIDSSSKNSIHIIESESTISIKQIRHMQSFLNLSTNHKKIVIIDSAELMTNNSANCILKMLENPLRENKIILTANNFSTIPRSIILRCLVIYTPILTKEETLKVLFMNSIDTTTEEINNLFGSPGILLEGYKNIIEFYALLKTNPNTMIISTFLLKTELTYKTIGFIIYRFLISQMQTVDSVKILDLYNKFNKIHKLIQEAQKLYLENKYVLQSIGRILTE